MSSPYVPVATFNSACHACQHPLPASRPPANPLLTCQPPTAQPAACKPHASHLLAHQPPASQGPASHPLAHPAASGPAASPQPTCLLPGSQLAASHSPGPQAPTHSQSEAPITCCQSENSLFSKGKILIDSCPLEEGQIQGSDSVKYSDSPEYGKIQVSNFENNSTPNQWDSEDQTTCLSPDPSQTKPFKTKIDCENSMSLQHHLTPLPGEIISSSQEWPNPQQIFKEQEFGHFL
ncbi:hypothetical protein DSO57_1020222 [Entomophthora muscae]|uniref:Uncharacterized protein n=1 Tax=Entomophthora muscae TaxID=34485 RepID=A0ACC2U223_9FUNG|nr:hypothetical protein DSO57_1020222 [Entomophthora muscae]